MVINFSIYVNDKFAVHERTRHVVTLNNDTNALTLRRPIG